MLRSVSAPIRTKKIGRIDHGVPMASDC